MSLINDARNLLGLRPTVEKIDSDIAGVMATKVDLENKRSTLALDAAMNGKGGAALNAIEAKLAKTDIRIDRLRVAREGAVKLDQEKAEREVAEKRAAYLGELDDLVHERESMLQEIVVHVEALDSAFRRLLQNGVSMNVLSGEPERFMEGKNSVVIWVLWRLGYFIGSTRSFTFMPDEAKERPGISYPSRGELRIYAGRRFDSRLHARGAVEQQIEAVSEQQSESQDTPTVKTSTKPVASSTTPVAARRVIPRGSEIGQD